MKVKNENKIRGELVIKPQSTDVTDFEFKEQHINEERGHEVEQSEVQGLIDSADFQLVRWKGKSLNYYGKDGAVYLNLGDRSVRTAFKREEYDDGTEALLKEVLKYVRKRKP